ncbi:MAG: hypothetical protein U1F27_04815 [Turneriella sp.]
MTEDIITSKPDKLPLPTMRGRIVISFLVQLRLHPECRHCCWYILYGDANDSSGNRFHGFFPPGETELVPGKNRQGIRGQALDCDGLDNASGGDYVKVNDEKALAVIRTSNA